MARQRNRIKALPKVYTIARDKTFKKMTGYAITEIQKNHMKHRYSEVYYAGENYNLLFTKREVKRIIEMWNEGATFLEMLRYARLMSPQKNKRTGSELFILLLDLADKEKIKPRENYDLQHFIFGG